MPSGAAGLGLGGMRPLPLCRFGAVCVACPFQKLPLYLPPHPAQLTAEPQSVRARERQCEGLGLRNPPALTSETSGQVIWADELCLVGEGCVSGRLQPGWGWVGGCLGAQAPCCPSLSSESCIPRGSPACMVGPSLQGGKSIGSSPPAHPCSPSLFLLGTAGSARLRGTGV